MYYFTEKLKWSPNFVREFGLIAGVPLLLRIVRRLESRSSIVREFKVPGYTHPIALRSTIGDHATFRQCLVMKQYDFGHFKQAERLLAFYEHALQSNKVPLIVDCGANIGLATLWFAKKFPRAHIVSIEPDEDNFRLLERNTHHLQGRITLLRGGIWNESSTLRIKDLNAGSASFQVELSDPAASDSVRSYTMREVVSLFGNDVQPLIAKLDIEGAQEHLFLNNTGWVRDFPLLTLELDDWLFPWRGSSRNFFKCLVQYPFDYLISKESIFCFQDIHPNNSCLELAGPVDGFRFHSQTI